MADDTRSFELNTGARIPSLGLGTWQSSPGLVGDAVATAVKGGYPHIDCAQRYGNEKEIGLVLKKLFEDGVVKREDLWITSKLWCTDHAPEDVLEALDRTLRDLQLDYVDLYLMHWPVRLKKGSVSFAPENLVEPDIPCSWRAMETLYDSGKARAIGVSNFSTKKLSDLLDVARVPPAVVQVECHPSWQQAKLHSFCKSKGVHVSGYSPLGSPGTTWIKGDVLQNPILHMVAEKLKKTPAQVALRWGLQMGHSALPKSTNEARIKENSDVFGWSIPEDLLAKLSEIEQEVPDEFPFKIIDIPGEKTILLKRQFQGETIQVGVDAPHVFPADEDSDEYENDDPGIPMVVSISKENGMQLEFGVTGFEEEVSIDSLSIVHPDHSPEQFPYDGPEFHELDEGLQNAFYKYLEARGIQFSMTIFLTDYMRKKDNKEYLLWLKNLKGYIEQ